MAQEDVTSAVSRERNVIGIALGNCYGSIACINSEGKAVVIANEDGDRQIPAILSYVEGEEYSGQQAKQQLIRNGSNTVAYFRDFLGQDFESIDRSNGRASAQPLKHEDTIAFKIKDKVGDEESLLSIHEIVTRQIRRLVQSASDYTGKQIDAAVITIPTNFNEGQKAAMIRAANNAGIQVLQFIHEPLAALSAYDARPGTELSDKNVIVADLGGTRSDVAVISSRAGMYTILATAHKHVGGEDLDKVLQDHFAKEFIKWNGQDADPRNNARSLSKLKLEAEATKKALSIGTNASFSVESLNIGVDFSSTINRLRYETIARSVLEQFNKLVLEAVEKAGLDVLDVDEVILSGGTSHTPKIASNMRNVFTCPKTVILAPSITPTAINPSELHARGAALQASLLKDYTEQEVDSMMHESVLARAHLSKAIGVLSISNDVEKGTFIPIILPETGVPVRRTIQIAAPSAGGDVLIAIAEGDSSIKVTKPEAKAKTNGGSTDGDDESEEDEEDEDEDEELREKIWKASKIIGHAAIRGVQKAGKIEITLSISDDLKITITARELGAKSSIIRGMAQLDISP